MRKYRVDESFEWIGAFWKFGQQNVSFTGTLRSLNGRVRLLAAPSYIASMDADDLRTAMQMLGGQRDLKLIPSICGFTTDGLCTLLDSVMLEHGGNIHFPTGQRLNGVSYSPARVVMGLHVESADAPSIEQASFYLSIVNRILPTPWHSHISDEGISYQAFRDVREVFRFTSTEIDAEVICEVFASSGSALKSAVTIKSVPRIRIIPNTPKHLNWFTKLALRVENFFTLLMGTSVSLRRIQLLKDGENGWVVQKMNHRREKFDVSICVRCPHEEVASALQRWLTVPIDKQPVELVVLGMMRKSKVFMETEFLSFAQALEGFGRIRLSAPKETLFAALIESSYDLLSADFAKDLLGERSTFTTNVVQTRNYYTHLGNARGYAATKDNKELFLLNKRLQAFLRCIMLIDLGVSEQLMREPILRQAKRWKVA